MFLRLMSLFIAFLFSAIAMAQSDFEKLNSSKLKEKMLLESAGRITLPDSTHLILIPVGKGNYRVIVRTTDVRDPNDTAPLRRSVSEQVVGYSNKLPGNGTKITYEHDNPKLSEQYGLQSVSSYVVNIPSEIIHDLAYSNQPAGEFYALINKGEALPAIGGGVDRELISDPVEVSTYNLDPAVNREFHVTLAKVWQACWDPSDFDTSNDDPLDKVNTSKRVDRDDCTDAKHEATKPAIEVRGRTLDALLEESGRSLAEVTAAADRAALELAEAQRELSQSESELSQSRTRLNAARKRFNQAKDGYSDAQRVYRFVSRLNQKAGG